VPFHFITPVWGERFTERYLQIFLPAQLHNLAQVRSASIYKIVTDRPDIIRQSDAFERLSAIMPVQFLPLPLPQGHAYVGMTQAYRAALGAEDISYVFLTPDSIWSDGSFAALERLVARGYRAVMVSGPRVAAEPFLSDFGARRSISARELAQLTVRHTHRIIEACMFCRGFHNTHPAAIYWRTPDCLIARHYVHHPLLLRPSAPITEMHNTLDFDLVPSHVAEREIHVCCDSDEILGVDVAPSSYDQGTFAEGDLSDEHVITWFERGWPTSFHARLARHTIYVHSGDLGLRHFCIGLMAGIVIHRIALKMRMRRYGALAKRATRQFVGWLRPTPVGHVLRPVARRLRRLRHWIGAR
jgi:hypothetical protein